MQWEATWDEYKAINDGVCDYAIEFNNNFAPTYSSVVVAMTDYLVSLQTSANQIVSLQLHHCHVPLVIIPPPR